MDRPGRLSAALLLLLCGCATDEPGKVEVVARDCRIALPYVKAEVGECTPRSAAAYDFAFCYLHYVVAAAAAPPADRARGEAGLSAKYKRQALAYGKVSQALSDEATFRRNIGLAKKYYQSLQKQNPMVTGSSLEYIRGKCDNLLTYHVDVIRGDQRL